jgi:hypothetical protein
MHLQMLYHICQVTGFPASRLTCTTGGKISRFVDSTHFPRDFLQNTNEHINGTICRITSSDMNCRITCIARHEVLHNICSATKRQQLFLSHNICRAMFCIKHWFSNKKESSVYSFEITLLIWIRKLRIVKR